MQMIKPKSRQKIHPPSSVTNFRVNFIGLIFFFVALFLLKRLAPALSTVHMVLFCLLINAIPLWVYDFISLKVYKRASTGLAEQKNDIDKKRFVTKMIGLMATFLIIVVAYSIVPFYRHSFFSPFFYYLRLFGPAVVLLSFFYFWEIDRRQKDPYDSYWHMGCLLTGRFKEVNRVILFEHARVWFIKAFFLPLMVGGLVGYIDRVSSFKWQGLSFFSIFDFLMNVFYTMDIVYGVLGYILTLRILDTHIRSADPTWLGWLFCLTCYYPFSTYYGMARFPFEDGLTWNNWLFFFPVSYYVVGAAILLLTFVYTIASVAFGYRASNLTFRGIITSGPYRYLKHPAYVCKVASWWLGALPFFSVAGPTAALKHTFNLLVVTFFYYMRARTEENHLSNYPEYVAYAKWIDEHGLFRFFKKRFPVLRFSEEKYKRRKSVVWFKQF